MLVFYLNIYKKETYLRLFFLILLNPNYDFKSDPKFTVIRIRKKMTLNKNSNDNDDNVLI